MLNIIVLENLNYKINHYQDQYNHEKDPLMKIYFWGLLQELEHTRDDLEDQLEKEL